MIHWLLNLAIYAAWNQIHVYGKPRAFVGVQEDPLEEVFGNSIKSLQSKYPGQRQSFFIQSNIPVNLLQYHSSFEPNRLISHDEVLVFLKNSCVDDEKDGSFYEHRSIIDMFTLMPSLENEYSDVDGKSVLYIHVNDDSISNEILPPSKFSVQWESSDFACEFNDHAYPNSFQNEEDLDEPSNFPPPIDVEEANVEEEETTEAENIEINTLDISNDNNEAEDFFLDASESTVEPEIEHEKDDIYFFMSEFSQLIKESLSKTIDGPKDRRKMKEKKQRLTKAIMDMHINSLRGDPHGPKDKDNETKHGCSVTAEVLYDACSSSVTLAAPSYQVYDKHAVTDVTSVDEEDCKVNYDGFLIYDHEPLIYDNTGSPILIPQLSHHQCIQVIAGRPFLDKSGNHIQAQAHLVESREWFLYEDDKNNKKVEKNKADNEIQEDYNFELSQEQGLDWTNRALGEYSSIASFAAFAIALMTNNAPPSLIKDALEAAMDEFRHARTSFNMASLLTSENISPGPLPPTSLSFEQDINSLAIETALQGCIDETLSALIAASEVLTINMNDEHINSPELWKEKVIMISKEEARHSALAWRTIHWICHGSTNLTKDTSTVICEDVVRLISSEGNRRVEERIKLSNLNDDISSSVQIEWTRLLNILLPQLSNESEFHVEDFNHANSNNSYNFINEITNDILNHFVSGTRQTTPDFGGDLKTPTLITI